MKKLISILSTVSLTATEASSFIACDYIKPKIINQPKKSNKTKHIVKKSTIKILQKATDQQFADEIVNIINKKKYIYKNENALYNYEIKNFFNKIIKNTIKIKNFDTSEFDKTKIKLKNIDLFYLSEDKLKNIIIKYNGVKNKIKINLIVIKKEEKNLSKMSNYNFREIEIKNDIPTKTELAKYIKYNNFNFEEIKEDDFEILKQNANNAIITGKGKYTGTIELTYEKKIINLNVSFIGNSQNIFLDSYFFKKQNVNVFSIQQEDVKKLVINYIIETYGIMIYYALPGIDLENDIALDFKDNVFPFNLENKKEIKFIIIGINNARGKINIKLIYSN